jgi:HEAT repeat protein
MLRCRALFDSDSDLAVRRGTVELLRVVSDPRVLPWIADFLSDSDEAIQTWGIGVLDQLVLAGLVDD